MAMVTDGVGHLSGGQLLSALYQHSLHGDTRHASLVQDLLSRASHPWYQWLYLWTSQGVLVDAHEEFFIEEHTSIDDRHLWRSRYTIREEQIIPAGILGHDLVRPAWILGKGINFIRKCLLDAEWRINLGEDSQSANDDEKRRTQLGYRYLSESGSSRVLRRTLLRVGEQVHSHILKSLRDDHHLMDHLWGLKQFLFLGQGDFFSAFMDGMHAEWMGKQGLAGVYKHSIMAIMDEAVRSTNARQLPPYVLERLEVQVTIGQDDDAFYQFAAPHGENVQDQRSPWDVIQLDYSVPDTLTAIVDEFAMKRYKLVFALLFRLKRVEFVLNATWRQSTALHHAMQTFAQHNAIQVSTSSGYARALVLLRKISMARQSMMHFVGNLTSYFMYEVLEGGWKDLERHVEAAKTLDEVIESHGRYLESIVRKSLLGDMSESAGTKSETALASRLQELLMIAKTFCELQEILFSDALSAVERATEKRKEAERRMEEGKWGFNKEEDFREEGSFFGLTNAATLQEVGQILDDFNEKTLLLLEGLDSAVNGDIAAPTVQIGSPATPSSRSKANGMSTWTVIEHETVSDPFDHDSLRFLAFQLNFSSYFGEKGNYS
jgi:gamma-tubulin complex component 3